MKPIAILFLVAFFVGCETIVEVDVPNPPKLVINSTLAPDNFISVNLSESKYILDQNEYEYNYITAATIDVYEDGALLESLPYSMDEGLPPGYYTSATHKPIRGKSYKVVASKSGYMEAYAEVLLPLDMVNILNVTVDTVEINDFGYTTSYLRFNIVFKEDRAKDNYYSVSIDEEYYFYNYDYNTDPPVIVDSVLVSQLIYNIRSEDPIIEDYQNGRDHLVFNDRLINGDTYTLRILVENNEYYPGDDPYNNYGPKKYKVLLSNTSESYFLYNTTVYLQSLTKDNPFAEPVQVYTNVTNGFGILEAYNTSTYNVGE